LEVHGIGQSVTVSIFTEMLTAKFSYSLEIFERVELRAKPSMNTQELLVHYGC
jgi:uncharacterized Rmd1/YagE family protein